MNFGSFLLVVIAIISCFQLESTVGYESECGQTVYYTYEKVKPLGIEVNGVLNLTYLTAPFGTFLKIDSAVANDRIIEIGVSGLSEDLHGIPTSDDSARIDRQSFFSNTGSAPGMLTAVLPVYVDPTEQPTYSSIYIVSQDNINNKPILNWAAGDEWQTDYTGQCDDYQGYFLEVNCDKGGQSLCKSDDDTVSYTNYGSIGSGNFLEKQLSTDVDCNHEVTFFDSAAGFSRIALTVYIDLAEGDVLRIYDERNNNASLLAEFTSDDEAFVQKVVYTTTPDSFYVEFETDSSTTARGNGFSIVYERITDTAADQMNCFSPSSGCYDNCLSEYTCSYDLAFGYLIDPNFDWTSCCTGTWTEECVLAAYTIDKIDVCPSNAKRSTSSSSSSDSAVFLNSKKSNKADSVDVSKRSTHMRNLKA